MARFAQVMRVLFVEEPVATETAAAPRLTLRKTDAGVLVVVPELPADLDEAEQAAAQRALLKGLIADQRIVNPILWYCTPMSMSFSQDLDAETIVYDCMDELTAFSGAPPAMLDHERQLFRRADLVFTGGHSLYEAKQAQHHHVHLFPNSVDADHFRAAREEQPEPADQAAIPHPRLGFYGVLDERLDVDLLAAMADLRPEWHFVMVGPVVKIDPTTLPQRPNVHYLGGKRYEELPAYLAGWDAAVMPFALNESTQFISPTKTLEYIAAGKPVVSTPVADVVRAYGVSGLVRIAATAEEVVTAAAEALADTAGRSTWLSEADDLLRETSWDATWEHMIGLIDAVRREARAASRRDAWTVARFTTNAVRSTRAAGFDYLIVGAGFAGSVLAERLAAGSNKRVLLIDRRPHIGGNAYDRYDDAGLLIHQYGPHIFHTNSQQVAAYLSRFTQWRPYEHRVLASVRGSDGRGLLVPIPINRTTINRLYGLDFATDDQVAAFLAARAEPVEPIRTSEDVVVSQVGRELYETFFRGYTRKQWGMDPSALDKAVTARVPTRTNADDRYFGDSFQNMPKHGFTRMFENMLDHPNIKILLNADYREVAKEVRYDRLIYTGPVDEFFDFRFGELPYRSLRFRHETVADREWHQPVAVVNYPAEDVPYTRVTEYKHLTGQTHRQTSITYEFPAADGDPYYPVPRPENAELYRKYQALADQTRNVAFVGRLATYKYYNMDQVVGQALATYARISGHKSRESTAAAAAHAVTTEPTLTR
jgi:UDP-galactopyranose mutase